MYFFCRFQSLYFISQWHQAHLGEVYFAPSPVLYSYSQCCSICTVHGENVKGMYVCVKIIQTTQGLPFEI